MSTYISGPITTVIPGVTKDELKQRFYDAARELNDPVNPLDVAGCPSNDCGPHDGHTWECWLKYDLIALLGCDSIYLLPDWEKSAGARLEFYVATQVGMKVVFAE